MRPSAPGVAPPGAARTRRSTRAAREIIADVRAGGDAALLRVHASTSTARASRSSRSRALSSLRPRRARRTTRRQRSNARSRTCGAFTRRRRARRCPWRPRRACAANGAPCRSAVGLYVPAGSAPLPSTAIMLAVPAQIAGCPDARAVHAAAARRHGRPRRALRGATLRRASGSSRWAVRRRSPRWPTARESVPQGRQDLRTRQRLGHRGQAAGRPAIRRARRRPAGGSVRGAGHRRSTARAEFVAADLLAQAEHSPDAQVILVTTSRRLAEATSPADRAATQQLAVAEIVRQSLEGSRICASSESRGRIRGEQCLCTRAPDPRSRAAARLAANA